MSNLFHIKYSTGIALLVAVALSAWADDKVKAPVKMPAKAVVKTPAKPAGQPANATPKMPSGIPNRGGANTPKPVAPTPSRPSSVPTQRTPQASVPSQRSSQTSGLPARPPIGQSPRPPQPQAKQQVIKMPNGNTVTTRGKTTDIHVPNRNMDVHRGIRGTQQVTMRRPDGSVVSAQRGSRSYIQRSYRVGNHDYARRTYVYNGRSYDRYYQSYSFHNVVVESYTPAVYYATPYYGWVYNPWQAPITYSWGWNAQPWWGYYSNYFVPAPVYPSASVWLTDYLVSQSLQESYQSQTAADVPQSPDPSLAGSSSAPPPPITPPAPVTPEVKAQIALEVQRQVAIESDEANKTSTGQQIDPSLSGLGRILTDGAQHVFVAGRTIDVVDATGLECAVSEGDVLSLPKPPPGAATAADLNVLTSKGDPDCHPGAIISVAFAEIQEMQNHMRDLIDQGMATLHDQGGKNGLPTVPKSAVSITKADFAAQAPPPDPNAAAEIERDLADADKATKAVPATSASAETAAITPAAPASPQVQQISLTGMNMDQVKKTLGSPTATLAAGSNKKVWIYSDMRVTFTNGVVTGIE